MNIDIVIRTCRSNPSAPSNPAHATFVFNKLELKFLFKIRKVIYKKMQ